MLLLDILDSSRTIVDAVAEFGPEEFMALRIIRSGILYELTIIGEAANQLSPELRSRYPDIPWRRIIDFRNLIVHGYFALTWERVWETVSRNVPELRAQIEDVLTTEFPNSYDT